MLKDVLIDFAKNVQKKPYVKAKRKPVQPAVKQLVQRDY